MTGLIARQASVVTRIQIVAYVTLVALVKTTGLCVPLIHLNGYDMLVIRAVAVILLAWRVDIIYYIYYLIYAWIAVLACLVTALTGVLDFVFVKILSAIVYASIVYKIGTIETL